MWRGFEWEETYNLASDGNEAKDDEVVELEGDQPRDRSTFPGQQREGCEVVALCKVGGVLHELATRDTSKGISELDVGLGTVAVEPPY